MLASLTLRRNLAAFCLAAMIGLTARAHAAEEVDLELVLAVDVSHSMNAREIELQRTGYVEALTHPSFVRAIKAGRHGRIAVTYMQWGGSDQQWQSVGWMLIDSDAAAQAFASQIPLPETINAQGTSISGALAFSARLLETNAFAGARKVIDVSGDGPNNTGQAVFDARAAVISRGITINGLPIIDHDGSDFPGIDRYYAECVIGGQGAFILPAGTIDEFALAIRRKLVLEVIGALPRQLETDHGQVIPAGSNDCLIGEKNREKWLGRHFPQL